MALCGASFEYTVPTSTSPSCVGVSGVTVAAPATPLSSFCAWEERAERWSEGTSVWSMTTVSGPFEPGPKAVAMMS